MCDIYYSKCSVEGCSTRACIHLADFATERDEVEFYCWNHIPEDTSDGILYEVADLVEEKEEPSYRGANF